MNKGQRIVTECTYSGEPFFVFRGKDILSPLVLADYLEYVEKYEPENHEMQEAIATAQREFREWQLANGDKLRLPD